MSSITINDLVYDAKSGDQLDNVSLELKSPQVIGICSNDTGAATALEDLLSVRGKILNGDVTINRVPFKKYKRQSKNEIGRIDDVVLKGKTVAKAVDHALRHRKNALKPEQALQMLKSLKFEHLYFLKIYAPNLIILLESSLSGISVFSFLIGALIVLDNK